MAATAVKRDVALQEDGNLVLYTKDSKVAWASNTDIKSSDAYTFEVNMLDLSCTHPCRSAFTENSASAATASAQPAHTITSPVRLFGPLHWLRKGRHPFTDTY